jgi:hypothetical protein
MKALIKLVVLFPISIVIFMILLLLLAMDTEAFFHCLLDKYLVIFDRRCDRNQIK